MDMGRTVAEKVVMDGQVRECYRKRASRCQQIFTDPFDHQRVHHGTEKDQETWHTISAAILNIEPRRIKSPSWHRVPNF